MRLDVMTAGLALLLLMADAQAQVPQPMSAVTASSPVTTVVLAGRTLQLSERDGHCALLRDDEVLPLAIGAPCYFSTGRDRHAQVHVFKGTPIVLVQHAHPTVVPDWDIATYGPICAFESQSVRDLDGVLEPGLVGTGIHCDPTGGADQKVFVYGYHTWPTHEAQKPSAGHGPP